VRIRALTSTASHPASPSIPGSRAQLQHHPEVITHHPVLGDPAIGDAVNVDMLDREALAFGAI
jgi:hypothetical protein